MIPAMIACFFGAALAAACDPDSLARPEFGAIPTLGAGDDIVSPGACAETEAACTGALTCVWSGDRCAAMDLAARP